MYNIKKLVRVTLQVFSLKEKQMKEKIDFSKCIRTDCKRCNQFKICFKEKKKNEKKMDKTKCNKLY